MTFTNALYTIVADVAGGVVKRTTTSGGTEFNRSDIDGILSANAEERNWFAWPCKDPGAADSAPHRWIRSDNAAMAVLESNRLVVTAVDWDRRSQDEAAPAGTNVTAGAVTTTNAVVHGVTRTGPPRPEPPRLLPPRSAPRQKALELLGRPAGTVRSGRREVLMYGWGNVILYDESVLAIDRGPGGVP